MRALSDPDSNKKKERGIGRKGGRKEDRKKRKDNKIRKIKWRMAV